MPFITFAGHLISGFFVAQNLHLDNFIRKVSIVNWKNTDKNHNCYDVLEMNGLVKIEDEFKERVIAYENHI